ncbi:MAG TPA: 6,7-dimethyl-8-ribityllumazine synthase [Aquificae bacterium]|nr:6,7-dimethyl-8-ribityllumazine synthase [Aquificota bacterium]
MNIKTIEGIYTGKDFKIGIVVSRFNSALSDRLLEGALDCLLRHEVEKENILVLKVPGAFEIPIALDKLAQTNKFDGLIALGCLIRGATPHFDFIASQTTRGISQVSLKYSLPITYGLITADTLDQAIERAGAKSGNKGFEAALALLELLNAFDIVKNL